MVTCAALRYGRDAKSTPAKPPRSVLAAKPLERFSDDPGGGAYHRCLSGGWGHRSPVCGRRLPFIKSPVKAETAVEKGRGLATERGRLFERFKGNNEALYLKHDRCGNN